MALTLAIDLGTTNLKVGLINEKGEVLSISSSPIETLNHEPGSAEHNPGLIKDLLTSLCRKVIENQNKGDVKYIISSTYHLGLMMLDEKRNPLTGITLLTDTRSQLTFSDFLSEFETKELYFKTGCPLISQYLLPRLYYFSKKKQDLFGRVKYFHDSKSFLFEWLTGEWITDISTASATQIFNMHMLQWDQDILSNVNLSGEQFPPVADGTRYMAPLRKDIGTLLGLNEGTQVILGVYDGAVLGYGLSGLCADVGIINIGTTAMLRLPGKQPVFDQNENKRIQAYVLTKEIFLNGGALNNATLPLNWLRNNLFDFDLQNDKLLNITNEPPLISLPYLTGERDSKTGPFASGVFFGIRPSHSKIDFVRSMLEGVAYSMRFIYDALKENNLYIKEIRMGGGGVNIKVWPQLFADILGVPVRLPIVKEISLVGNSILAFTFGGLYKNTVEAHEIMSKPGTYIHPDENAMNQRERHYEFYIKFRESIGSLYNEHAQLRN